MFLPSFLFNKLKMLVPAFMSAVGISIICLFYLEYGSLVVDVVTTMVNPWS